MKKFSAFIFALILASALVSCSSSDNPSSESSAPQASQENSTEEITEEQTEEITEDVQEETVQEVSSEEPAEETSEEIQTVPPEEVGYEGMTAVYAENLADGEYDISVDSSSSMFKIKKCRLTVADGNMTASMVMGGTGYQWLFLGTADNAANADESEYIPYTEENDVYTFTIPVNALDEIIDCAAYSKKKETWYDRQLVFRADSLPDKALKEAKGNTVEIPRTC